ncbi:hypothetical protein Tco_1414106 [Tanacetum coccineum]
MSSDEASSGVTYTSTSSDYEEPSDTEQAPLSLDYVPGPEYPEYLAPSDDEIPIEDQPYAAPASPIALYLGYIADSDPEEDLEDESKDGLTDYPAGGGEDDNDDSSGDDADEEEEASKEDEEEEENLASTDSTAATSPVVDLVPSAEETKPFETDESAATPPPPPAYRTTARMSIRAQAPIPFSSKAEIPSPPLPVPSPPTTSPTYVEAPLGFREAGIRLRAASPLPSPTSPPTHHPLPLPPPSSPFLPPVYHREDIPEADIPPWKRLCLTAPTPRFEVGESSAAAATRQSGLGAARTTDLVFPTCRAHLSDRVDILLEDRKFHQQTTMLMEDEALVSREAWVQAMGSSAAVHYELQAYRAHTQIHDLCISSQEALTATLVAQVSSLQSQLIAALGQIQALQARDLAHVDDPEDADSCS